MDLGDKKLFGEDIFTKRLENFKWEKDDDESSMIVYRAETMLPIPAHYADKIHAEKLMIDFRKFIHEWYSLAEVTAFELMGTIRLYSTPQWEQAPEKVTEFMMELLTDPVYLPYLNTEYPDPAEGFGKKIINLEVGAAIFSNQGTGDRCLTFIATARAGTQDAENKYFYHIGDIIKTVYN
jgi:hypothetical protein